VNATKTIESRWTQLNAKKSTVLSQSEQYSRWTLPYLFPPNTTQTDGALIQGTNDSIGARCVNHLSNKVITTLFRPQGAFFRLHLPKKQIQKIAKVSGMQDQKEIAAAIGLVEAELADVEAEATEKQNMVEYRPNATTAAKLLIVTGNALIYHPDLRPVQVFNVRDYCVVRDLSGTVIEIITKEEKAFETFAPSVQEQLRAYKKHGDKTYDGDDNVTIYTQIKLEDNGKFHVYQEAGCVKLDTEGVFYPRNKLPWVVLTWNLVRGEDYGRGLVEEYAGTFHSLEVYHQSLINIAGIMGDIKFLVNPASLVDVQAMNSSPAGSYHSGRDGDVTAIETKKQHDAQFILSMIERNEKNLAQAFLLNSSMTRDAERVTAEEIRMVANELETSNGGVYSRLALQWQVPTANILLDQIEFDGDKFGITPSIITGMDSLSRQGEMDNLRLFISDIAMLEAVPEDIRAGIDPLKFMAFIGTARQIEYNKFLMTDAQLQQKQQQKQQMLAQQEAMKANGAVAAEAGKAAVQGAQ
jgi:hypothetical protein